MARRHIIQDIETKGLPREKAHSITFKGHLRGIESNTEKVEMIQAEEPVEIITKSLDPVVVPLEMQPAVIEVEVAPVISEVKAVEVLPEAVLESKPIEKVASVPEKKKGGFQKKIKEPDPTSGVPQAE